MSYNRSEHVIGYGKSIAYSDTINGTYTPVYGTIDVTLPERELEKTEITNDSTPDATKDYLPGLYEPGEGSFKYAYGKTQYAAIETVFQLATVAATRASATKFWKVTLPDGATAVFPGFMTKHPLPVEIDGVPTVEVSIQATGKTTYTAAVST